MMAGQALSAAGGLLSVRLLTTLYPREVYGLSWLFVNAVTLASLLTAGSLGQTFSRLFHDDDSPGHLAGLLGLAWRLQLLMTGAASLLYLALFAARGVPAGGESLAFLAMPVYFFFLSMLTIAQLILNAGRRRWQRILLTVLDAWLKPCGALLLCLCFRADVNSFVLGYAGTTVLLGLLGMGFLDRLGGVSLFALPKPKPEECRRVIAYSVPLMAIALTTWLLALSDRYIVNWQLGGGAAGTYVAAYQVGSALFQLLGGAFGPLVQPIVFRRGSQSLSAGGEAISLCYRAFAWLSVPVLALFVLCYQWMMRWLVAPSYWSGVTAVLWVGAGSYLWVLGNVGIDAFQVTKRNLPLLAVTGGSVLVNIALNLLLVRVLGIVGAGVATALSYALYALGIVLVGRSILPYRFPWQTFATVALMSGVAVLAGKSSHILIFAERYDLVSFAGVLGVFVVTLAAMVALLKKRLTLEWRILSGGPGMAAVSA